MICSKDLIRARGSGFRHPQVTALSPIIGYDKAAAISHTAIDHDLTLKEGALAKGVDEKVYDEVVNPLA